MKNNKMFIQLSVCTIYYIAPSQKIQLFFKILLTFLGNYATFAKN